MAIDDETRRVRDAQSHRQQRARRGGEINARRRERYSADAEVRGRIKDQVAEYQGRNPEKIRQRNRRAYERRRPSDLIALMWDSQNGDCYLCGEPLAAERKIVIEHDHGCCPSGLSCSVCRRGLAHHRCNVAIGMADDDPEKLRRMADALEAAQLTVEARKAAVAQQLTLELEA